MNDEEQLIENHDESGYKLSYCCGVFWDRVFRVFCCTCYDYSAISYEQFRTVYRIRKILGLLGTLIGSGMLAIILFYVYFYDDKKVNFYGSLLAMALLFGGISLLCCGGFCCFEISHDWNVLGTLPRFSFNPPSYEQRQALGWVPQNYVCSDFDSVEDCAIENNSIIDNRRIIFPATTITPIERDVPTCSRYIVQRSVSENEREDNDVDDDDEDEITEESTKENIETEEERARKQAGLLLLEELEEKTKQTSHHGQKRKRKKSKSFKKKAKR